MAYIRKYLVTNYKCLLANCNKINDKIVVGENLFNYEYKKKDGLRVKNRMRTLNNQLLDKLSVAVFVQHSSL